MSDCLPRELRPPQGQRGVGGYEDPVTPERAELLNYLMEDILWREQVNVVPLVPFVREAVYYGCFRVIEQASE